MIPAVTVFSKPNGEPMASTHSPVRRSLALPSLTTGRSLALIFSTAMSVLGSAPSTFARNSRRSVSLTVTSVASFTTCALVMMMPSGLTMKPEPMPCIGTSCGTMRPWFCWKCRKNSNGSPLNASGPICIAVFSVPVTLMLTTAGPYSSVMCGKSGIVAVEAAGAPAAAGAVMGTGAACARTSNASTPAPPIAPAASSASTSGVDLRVACVMGGSFAVD